MVPSHIGCMLLLASRRVLFVPCLVNCVSGSLCRKLERHTRLARSFKRVAKLSAFLGTPVPGRCTMSCNHGNEPQHKHDQLIKLHAQHYVKHRNCITKIWIADHLKVIPWRTYWNIANRKGVCKIVDEFQTISTLNLSINLMNSIWVLTMSNMKY